VELNQGEIPPSFRTSLTDSDGDGRISYGDLNAPANASWVSDRNGNGYIDVGDLLGDARWCDGRDDDGDGLVDNLSGWNYYTTTNAPWDGNSHGTHVSGTIAAMSNNGIGVAGVNWHARILPMCIGSPDGGISTSMAVSAIYDAVDLGARVLNASWGGGGFSQALYDAVSYAEERGAVLVAAAGNYASDNDASAFYPASLNLGNVLAVAATDASGRLANFSNYGATSVALGAPGQGIASTLPGGG